MSASNDSQKKTTTRDEEMIVINGRKMLLMPDGSLVPIKKKNIFNKATQRMNNMTSSDNHDITMADLLARQKQND